MIQTPLKTLPMAPARCFHPFRAKKLVLAFVPAVRPEKKRREYQVFWLASAAAVTARLRRPLLGLKGAMRYPLSLLPVGKSPHATAYQPGRTLCAIGPPHVGQPFVVKLDIANFFGSIPFPSGLCGYRPCLVQESRDPIIRHASSCKGSSHRKLQRGPEFFLCYLCTPRRRFAAGRPPPARCCPILVFFPLTAAESLRFARAVNHYTRYSDDLTFSGDFSPDTLIRFIRRLLCEHGFLLHESKTVIARRGKPATSDRHPLNDRPQAGRKFSAGASGRNSIIFNASAYPPICSTKRRTGESCAPGPYLQFARLHPILC